MHTYKGGGGFKFKKVVKVKKQNKRSNIGLAHCKKAVKMCLKTALEGGNRWC